MGDIPRSGGSGSSSLCMYLIFYFGLLFLELGSLVHAVMFELE